MREAAVVAGAADAEPLYRIAIRDYHSALLEPTDDGLLYAYRAIEAVRRSITPGPASEETWQAMHATRGTDRAKIIELAELAQAVRHADEHDQKRAAAQAGPARQDHLALARDVVVRALTRLLGRDLALFD